MEEKIILREKIKAVNGEKLKIIVGSGGKIQESWIHTDLPAFDITKEMDWRYFFEEGSIDNILAEHVLEHIHLEEMELVFNNAHRYLRRGGFFRVAVPDGYHPSEFYKRMTRPNGEEPGADDHKVFFTIDLLRKIIDPSEFYLIPIEYCDREGRFHKNEYEILNGYVSRTAENYPGCFFTNKVEEYREFYDSIPEYLRGQFESSGYTYTSLFFDLKKK